MNLLKSILSKEIIQGLEKKLKIGNLRMSHLNVLPKRLLNRADLFSFSEYKNTLPLEILIGITENKNWRKSISFSSLSIHDSENLVEELFQDKDQEKKDEHLVKIKVLIKRLNNIAQTLFDENIEFGTKSIALGYPIIIIPSAQDKTKIIKAPLFLWSFDFEREKRKSNSWTIIKTEDHPVTVNEMFLNYLESEYGINLSQFKENLEVKLDDGVLADAEIKELIAELLKQISIPEGQIIDVLSKVSKNNEIVSFDSNDYKDSKTVDLINNGVITFYRAYKQSIINDLKTLVDNWGELANENEEELENNDPFTPIEVDPSQRKVIESLSKHQQLIIQGPPGTGKSQSLTAIILNALFNNKKCLVVCEKRTALDIIYKKLKEEGLGDYIAIVEDSIKDRKNIVDLARSRYQNNARNPYFFGGDQKYKSYIKSFLESSTKIDTHHKNLLLDLIDGKNWTSIVGKYLHTRRKVETEINQIDINSNIFETLDSDEYFNLEQKIKEAKKFYLVKNEKNSFSILQRDFGDESSFDLFSKLKEQKSCLAKDLFNISESIENKIITYTTQWEKEKQKGTADLLNVLKSINVLMDLYSSRINHIYEEHSQNLWKNIEIINTCITKLNQHKNQDLLLSSSLNSLKLKTFAILSSKYKEGLELRETIITAYNDIQGTLGKRNYFDTEILGQISNFSQYKNYSDSLSQLLLTWEKNRRNNVSLLLKDLSLKTFYQPTEIDPQLDQLLQLLTNYNEFVKGSFVDNKLQIQIGSSTLLEIKDLISNKIDLFKSIENVFKGLEIEDIHKQIGTYDDYIENSMFNKRITIDKKEKNILKIKQLAIDHIELLKLLENDFNYFISYSEWLGFYNKSKGIIKVLLNNLLKFEVDKWLDIFQAHFLYQVLIKHKATFLLTNSNDIEKCLDLESEINKEQRIIIKHNCEEMESIAFHNTNGFNFISLYNKKGGPGQKRNSLRNIVHFATETFKNLFPVLLVNPSTCSTILPLIQDLYDVVVFDEASQLRLEDTITSLIRGKIKVVSGDRHQMPPSSFFKSTNINNEDEDDSEEVEDLELINSENNRNLVLQSESLLEFAEESKFENVFLKVHYRSKHPYLIDFSNAAFYGNNLIPSPSDIEYIPIKYIRIDGNYSIETHTNFLEAEKVIEEIVNLEPVKGNIKEYPSVGVATFNLFQKTLIYELIQKKRIEDQSFADKMDKLEEKGFFVKNLENIQGDERDIIIVSTTFGVQNIKEVPTFRQNFGPLSLKNGYKLLNVIITRAKIKLIVCTSFPDEKIGSYISEIEQRGNNGKGILYAYLAYAKAVSLQDESKRQSILELLFTQTQDKGLTSLDPELQLTESPFEEEVVTFLDTIIPKERIELQKKYGGFRIDIVVKSLNKNKKHLAIECDGASYHSSDLAYAWDIFRQKYLEGHGFKFYRIWSTNWWRNTEYEMKRLEIIINKFDQGELDEI